MSSIDQRIVQMQFDNKQFEGGVQESLKTINNLKQGLNLDGATASLTNLENAGRSFSLAGISSGVESLSSKFSAMGVIGITALANITNAAVNAGKNIVSALTIDPIRTGLAEYETKMGSIQTILTNTASKGTTLKDVNAALDELNTYSDKTIYNFEEMTKNIGTFTAAGVDLKTSTMAIKGIANLAAGSGSSAMQASTAMYQLSQAIASGSVKLQDWNSVVNAGMGGELFQKALEKTAVSLGHGRDMSVSFRDSLQSGWLTTEVLTKTLNNFANDPSLLKAATQVKTFSQLWDTMKESVQSGWAQTWETIIGNKDESSKMLTSINDIFGAMVIKSANARNALLSFWKANGGRDAMIKAVSNAFTALLSVLKPVGDAYRSVFPATTGKQLVEITKNVRDFAAGLKIGGETAYNLKSSFQGVFAVLDIIKMAISAAAKAFIGLINSMLPAGSGILSLTGSFGRFLKCLDDTLKKTDFFGKAFSGVGGVLNTVAGGIANAIYSIIKSLSGIGSIGVEGISSFVNKVSKGFTPFTALGSFLKGVFSVIESVLSALGPLFTSAANMIGQAMDKIRNNVSTAVGGGHNSILDMLNAGLFAGILITLKKFIKAVPSLAEMAGSTIGKITKILDGVKGSLESYQKSLKAGTLMKIALAIGILATSLLLLSTIDSKKLTSALTAMSVMFIELFASMAVFEKVSGGGLLSMTKTSVGMIALSTAILILSGAMGKLAKLDWAGIAKGLVGIGGIMAELAIFMKVSNFTKMGVSTGVGIIALALGIDILASAVKKFSEINAGALTQGLIAVGAVLAEIVVFTKLVGNPKGLITTAIGMGILGASMLIFAGAIALMGSMSLDTIGKGLLTMAGALLIVGTAINFMPKSSILVGVGLLVISGALVILAGALKIMGGMSWDEIGKGLVALAGSLTILAVSMSFMQGALPGAAALLVISAALAIFAPVLLLLGSASLSTIGTGLLALAGAFTILGIAGLTLTPLTPVILSLAGAIALFGVGCLAVGLGMSAFALGITMLAAAGTAGAVAITLMITTILNMVPLIITTLVNGLVQFVVQIAAQVPTLVTAFTSMILAIITGISTIIPQVTQLFLNMMFNIMNVIAVNIPGIVKAAVNIIVAFINAVSSNLPRIIQAAIHLAISFINGLANGLRSNQGSLTGAVRNLMSAMISTAVNIVAGASGAFFSAGANIVRGMINGIKSKIQELAGTAAKMAKDALHSAEHALGIKSPSIEFAKVGMYSCLGFSRGLVRYASVVMDSASNLGTSAVDSLKSAISKISGVVNDNLDSTPVIKPVMDLSNVTEGSKRINGLLSGAKLNLSSITSNIPNVLGKDSSDNEINQNGRNQQGTSVSFTQNNYSPKSLSRLDIYRQTRNQVSALKGLVNV